MIGDQIKKKRVELDMTQAELAQKISVKANTISNYEKGISSPSEDIIYKLMDALKCDANFLFEWLTEEQKKSARKKNYLSHCGETSTATASTQ